MIYLVAAENAALDAPLARRFGQAPVHLLIDGKDLSLQALPARDGGGAGRVLRQAMAQGASAIISGNIGPRAFEHASSAGLPVFIVRSATVREAMAKVEAGQLDRCTEATVKKSAHRAHHSHGGQQSHGAHHSHGGQHSHGHGTQQPPQQRGLNKS